MTGPNFITQREQLLVLTERMEQQLTKVMETLARIEEHLEVLNGRVHGSEMSSHEYALRLTQLERQSTEQEEETKALKAYQWRMIGAVSVLASLLAIFGNKLVVALFP